jgi:H+/Cl- antiporter ClcA
VGAASGRLDALVFMAGVVGGVLVFAEVYTAIAWFAWSGELGGVTLADLTGVPFWALAALVVVMALGAFWLVRKVEPGAGGSR